MEPEPADRKALVSIATYNERENLPLLIQDIHHFAPQADVLVVDDNSPDGTGALVDQLAQADPRIHALHRPGKLGLGTAILDGLHYAMAHDYRVFVTMDADLSHHPRYLPALLAGMKDDDVMIGSRYVPGGGTVNWPITRRFMSWGVNTLVRFLMRIRARDTSGGYRAYRVELLRRANLEGFYSKGYSFQEEMLLRCKLAGAKIGETPILFEDRRFGITKVNYWEILRSITILIYLGLRVVVGLGPKLQWEARPSQSRNKETGPEAMLPGRFVFQGRRRWESFPRPGGANGSRISGAAAPAPAWRPERPGGRLRRPSGPGSSRWRCRHTSRCCNRCRSYRSRRVRSRDDRG